MKRAIIVLVAAAALLAASGCGRTQKTVTVPGGKATVTTEKGLRGEKQTVEVTTKEGKATVTTEGGKAVTEAELGVPVYPGAKSVSTSKYEGSEAGYQGMVVHHVLSTNDSFEKVTQFYKSKLKNPESSFVQTAGSRKLAVFMVNKDKTQIGVHVVHDQKEGKTIINVSRASKT